MKKLVAVLLSVVFVAGFSASITIQAANPLSLSSFNTTGTVIETGRGLELSSSATIFGSFSSVVSKAAATLDKLEVSYTLDSYAGTPGSVPRAVVTIGKAPGTYGWSTTDMGPFYSFEGSPVYKNGVDASAGYQLQYTIYECSTTFGAAYNAASIFLSQKLDVTYGQAISLAFKEDAILGMRVYANGVLLTNNAGGNITYSLKSSILTNGKVHVGFAALDSAGALVQATLHGINEGAGGVLTVSDFNTTGTVTELAGGGVQLSSAGTLFGTYASAAYKMAVTLENLAVNYRFDSYASTPGNQPKAIVTIGQSLGNYGWSTTDLGPFYSFEASLLYKNSVDASAGYQLQYAIYECAATFGAAYNGGHVVTTQKMDIAFGQTISLVFKEDAGLGMKVYANGGLLVNSAGENITYSLKNSMATGGKVYVGAAAVDGAGALLKTSLLSIVESQSNAVQDPTADYNLSGNVQATALGLQATTQGLGAVSSAMYKNAVTLNGLEVNYTIDSYADTPGSRPRAPVTIGKNLGTYGWTSTDIGPFYSFEVSPVYKNGANASAGYQMQYTIYECETTLQDANATAGKVVKTNKIPATYGQPLSLLFEEDAALGLRVYVNGVRLMNADGSNLSFPLLSSITTDGKVYVGFAALDGGGALFKATLSGIGPEHSFADALNLHNFSQVNAVGLVTENANGILMTSSASLWAGQRPTIFSNRPVSIDGLTATFQPKSFTGADADLPVIAIGFSEHGGPFGWPTPSATGNGFVLYYRFKISDGTAYIEGVQAYAGQNIAGNQFATLPVSDGGIGKDVVVELKSDPAAGYKLYINGTALETAGGPLDLHALTSLFPGGKAHVSLSVLSNSTHTLSVHFRELFKKVETVPPNMRTYDAQPGVAKTGALDFSWMNEAPAGTRGHVIARDGGFYFEDGNQIKFFGVNLGFGAAIPEKPLAEAMAGELASSGVNLVRIHAIDATYSGVVDYTQNTTAFFDPVALDRLDYLIYQLKQKGIYVHLDTNAARVITTGDGFTAEEVAAGSSGALRASRFIDSRIIAIEKAFTLNLLNHVNSYTQMKYALDPVIAILQYANESSITWYDTPGVSNVFTQALNTRFNNWLATIYGSRAALDAQWTDSQGNKALAPYEDPFQNTVAAPPLGSWGEATIQYNSPSNASARHADYMRFLMAVETQVFNDAYTAIRNTGFVSAINLSNQPERAVDLKLNALGDVMEKNVYWNHPTGSYDIPTTFHKLSMAITDPRNTNGRDMFSSHSVGGVSRASVADKPLVVTEWNVGSPTEFKADAIFQMAAYGALQDWDGLCLFTYTFEGTEEAFYNTKGYTTFFNSNIDPAMYAPFGMAAMMFRLGIVDVARNYVEVAINENDVLAQNADYYKAAQIIPFVSRFAYRFVDGNGTYNGNADLVIPCGNTASGDYTNARRVMMMAENPYADPFKKYQNRTGWFNHHLESSTTDLSVGSLIFKIGQKRAVAVNSPNNGGFYSTADFDQALTAVMKNFGMLSGSQGYSSTQVRSDTDQLIYTYNKSFQLVAPKAGVFAGIPDASNQYNAVGNCGLYTNNDRAAVAVVTLDNETIDASSKLLIYAMGRSVNSGMQWEGNLLTSLGDAPILYEDIRGTFVIPSTKPHCTVWGLDSLGNRAGSVPVTAIAGGFSIALGGYIHYEVIMS